MPGAFDNTSTLFKIGVRCSGVVRAHLVQSSSTLPQRLYVNDRRGFEQFPEQCHVRQLGHWQRSGAIARVRHWRRRQHRRVQWLLRRDTLRNPLRSIGQRDEIFPQD